MRICVMWIVVCVLGGNVRAQEVMDIRGMPKLGKLSLAELITDNTVIFQLTDADDRDFTWSVLAGGGENVIARTPSNLSFSGERVEMIGEDLKNSKKSKTYSPGNLTLYLWSGGFSPNYYINVWDYKADLHLEIYENPVAMASVTFPKYADLRTDLIWLCKNRYLLKLLKKGELTTEIYHLSPHQMELLVKVCPQSWMQNLLRYAKSGSYMPTGYKDDKVKTLYGFLNYDPTNAKEFPLLDEAVVRKLADGIVEAVDYERLFGDIESERIFGDIGKACEKVNEKLKSDCYITGRDTILLRLILGKKKGFEAYWNELRATMKDRIVKKGEVELLKTYLLKMKERKSLEDLMNLAEFVQSKTFLEGKAEFQSPIMDQFATRKEKEVVWILAPLIKHKDLALANRAKRIMQKLTSSDLGDEPTKWRDWYSEQNQ